jgi:hypothetical protein
MMTRRFRLVAVYLGAFSLGAASTAAQPPTRAVRAIPIAVSTAATNSATDWSSARTSRIGAPVPLSAATLGIDAAVPLNADQMRETVGAGWWQTLVTILTGVVESVVYIYVSDSGEACALNPSSCG